MTEDELKQKMQKKMLTIGWLKAAMGMPIEMVPKEACPKCHMGIVWGIKDGEDIRYIRGESGSLVRNCAECNDEITKRVIEAQIAETSRRFAAYEKKVNDMGLRYGEKIPSKKKSEDRGIF